MTDDGIEPEQYRAQIERLLRSIDLGPFEVLIEESVQAWAHSVDIIEKSPDRAGLAARRADGMAIIVLPSCITFEMQRGVKDALWAYGFLDEEIELLNSPDCFLKHLVLHEAAHLLFDHASEDECDRWAFDRLTDGTASA